MPQFLRSILKFFKDNVEMNKRGFFSTFFKTEAEDYVETNTVEIDIERNGAKVAPYMKSIKTGKVLVSAEDFNTEKFTPPLISLGYPVDLFQLMERQPGESEFAEVGSWLGRLFNKLKSCFVRMHKMVKESVELQAAQILQTGALILQDEESKDVYALNYPVKESHFPTVTTSWGTDGADPLSDLEALCEVVNDDGKADPSIAIFGKNAWNKALKNEAFKEAVKKDGLGLGALNPGLKNRGGRYMGYIDIGTFRLELWTYNDSYEKLVGDTKYKFMDPDKVVVSAAIEDLDFRCVFGGVPTLGMQEPFTSVIPSEVTYDGYIRVHNRVFMDTNQDTYVAETKSRPLCIPVSIDRFGCLNTVAAI